MTSTIKSEPILEAKNLSLKFWPNAYRAMSWRDLFTQALSRPALEEEQERHVIQIADHLNFKIFPGDRVGLIGVNGTGKTSLCRCMAGTYRPTSGKIKINGRVRAVFDATIGIQPELTGRENAELLSHFMYPGDPDRKHLVQSALDFSELGKFLDYPYRIYSNGMQARLSLSLVSAKPADLFILDEVFDGADTFFKERISKRMLEVIQSSGSVIFVSHSVDQIKNICNRVILLNQGKIAYDGPVESGLTLYLNSPCNAFAPSQDP